MGDDLISTGRGTDAVTAGTGNDRIEVDMSGPSICSLSGGEGADQFIFVNCQTAGISRAILTDFDPTQDLLTINGLTGYAAIASARGFAGLQDVGEDATLRFGDDVYVFKGLDAADFL